MVSAMLSRAIDALPHSKHSRGSTRGLGQSGHTRPQLNTELRGDAGLPEAHLSRSWARGMDGWDPPAKGRQRQGLQVPVHLLRA